MGDDGTGLLLVRHGETGHNRTGIIQGQTDVPLSDAGLAQAERLARRLADEPVDAVYASDLERASRTARVVGRPHGLAPTEVPALREQHVGDWEGRRTDALHETLADRGLSWVEWRPPNGEAWEAFAGRVRDAVETICERHAGERVVVVGHAEVNKAILSHAAHSTPERKAEFAQENACLNELGWNAGDWTVEVANEVGHLE